VRSEVQLHGLWTARGDKIMTDKLFIIDGEMFACPFADVERIVNALRQDIQAAQQQAAPINPVEPPK
jgi:hypothetical protein